MLDVSGAWNSIVYSTNAQYYSRHLNGTSKYEVLVIVYISGIMLRRSTVTFFCCNVKKYQRRVEEGSLAKLKDLYK